MKLSISGFWVEGTDYGFPIGKCLACPDHQMIREAWCLLPPSSSKERGGAVPLSVGALSLAFVLKERISHSESLLLPVPREGAASL